MHFQTLLFHLLSRRPRLLLHGSIDLISLFAPLLDFFPKKVRKAGDPGNHSFAIFPTVIILLLLLHENEVFDLVYDRSVYLNSSSKDTILHIVTIIKQESTFCVRYMFLYFSNV
uniref:Uncharacterized protein n=1 Tax=Lactuca sativa TaxID=4236 RepID=A0A9R1XXB3_LACSA|nr:hypothetical protein LSAT_V11C200100040 [Lactuca sativa]